MNKIPKVDSMLQGRIHMSQLSTINKEMTADMPVS